jgi:uncharacterized protein (TIGR04255 family)
LAGDSLDATLGEVFSDSGYPLLERGQQATVELTPDGPRVRAGDRVLTFSSANRKWRVSLTSEFVTLETSQYNHRDDFVVRLLAVVDTLQNVMTIPGVGRIGYRYINRVENITAKDSSKLLREQFHGGTAVPEGQARLMTSISEVLFSFDDDKVHGQVPRDGLVARWGMLQAGQVVDPSIEPVDKASWTLDIDAFRQADAAFDREAIEEEVRRVSERAYRFFRWVVTDDFMTRFGGGE